MPRRRHACPWSIDSSTRASSHLPSCTSSSTRAFGYLKGVKRGHACPCAGKPRVAPPIQLSTSGPAHRRKKKTWMVRKHSSFVRMASPTVYPAESELWTSFHPQNEMIVTNPGRALFPRVAFRISDLDANAYYKVELSLQRVDDLRYTFENKQWIENGAGEPELPAQLVEHKDGLRSGAHWMKEGISFGTLKITNKESKKSSKAILVQSMHKYVPVLHVSRLGQTSSFRACFPFMEFIVVTVYQNEAIKDLKVAKNKFAFGKRPRRADDQSDPENQTPSPPQAKRVDSSSPSNVETPPPLEPHRFGHNGWAPQYQQSAQQWYGGYWNQWTQYNQNFNQHFNPNFNQNFNQNY